MVNTRFATICYITNKNQTVMINRNINPNDIHKNKYVPPGGKIEQNETPDEGVKREVYEEAGLNIENPELVALVHFYNLKGRIPDDYIVWFYKTDKFSGKLKEICKEGILNWQDNEKIIAGELPMWDGDKVFTPWIYQGKKFVAEFTYHPEGLMHSQKFYKTKEELNTAIKNYMQELETKSEK